MILKSSILVLSLIWAGMTFAQEQHKRLALVIGNAAYQHGAPLNNPVNDANLMARTLKDLGFDVIKKTDAGLKDMQNAFKGFVARLDDYNVALFFYAGHGMQVDGQNYLIPVDARLEDKLSVEFEAFKVSSVNRYFAYNDDKLNIMILDACRNNPYRAWMRGDGQGFSAIDDQGAGTIIAFATREGGTASDGTGGNGLFSLHRVEQMKIPQNITDVFQNTRVSVLKASNKQQVPQEWNMLTGNFYFAQTALSESTNEDAKINDNPLLIPGNVDVGSIIIDTERRGDLYLDGKKIGYLQVSKGNQLDRISTGPHSLELVGSDTVTRQIKVYKDCATTALFEKKNEDYTFKAGKFTDSRDDKAYKCVRIGDQIWMAENLGYAMEGSYYNEKCDWFYTWEVAMKACPEGWHLPSDSEWSQLSIWGPNAAAAFKSKTGWKDNGNGTNSSGFTALPRGYRFHSGTFIKFGTNAYFWTSTERDVNMALKILTGDYDFFGKRYFYKRNALSCRCIRD